MKANASDRKLAEILDAFPPVALAYLFGSAAKARRTPRDIDVAVLLAPRLPPLRELSLRTRLADAVKAVVGTEGDIAILNSSSPFLKHQVLKYGRKLFERKQGIDARFRYDTMTEYFDALPLHDFFVREMNRRQRNRHGRPKTR